MATAGLTGTIIAANKLARVGIHIVAIGCAKFEIEDSPMQNPTERKKVLISAAPLPVGDSVGGGDDGQDLT